MSSGGWLRPDLSRSLLPGRRLCWLCSTALHSPLMHNFHLGHNRWQKSPLVKLNSWKLSREAVGRWIRQLYRLIPILAGAVQRMSRRWLPLMQGRNLWESVRATDKKWNWCKWSEKIRPGMQRKSELRSQLWVFCSFPLFIRDFRESLNVYIKNLIPGARGRINHKKSVVNFLQFLS